MTKKQSIDDLDDNYRIDDRWTETKLLAAGYEYKGEGPCRTCGTKIAFYKREKAGDYKGPAHWRVVIPETLEEHRCPGKR